MSRVHGPYCRLCESAPCACPWHERALQYLSESDERFIAAQDEADVCAFEGLPDEPMDIAGAVAWSKLFMRSLR